MLYGPGVRYNTVMDDDYSLNAQDVERIAASIARRIIAEERESERILRLFPGLHSLEDLWKTKDDWE